MINTIWSARIERGRESIVVRLPITACQACPVRPQCTPSTHDEHIVAVEFERWLREGNDRR